MNFTESDTMKKFKRLGIVLAAVIVLCTLIYTIKPIYYRVYPFDRFTVNYTVSYNGEEVKCREIYCLYEDEAVSVRKSGAHRLKIRGGQYGIYDISFVVNTKSLYTLTDYNEDFLAIEPFDCRFRYFNTNWWHITDFDIHIDCFEADGEWYAKCIMNVSEPDADESGKVNNYTYEGTFPMREINNYEYLPLSDLNE